MLNNTEQSPTLDLFNRAPFPHDPAYGKTDTSFDAAQVIKPSCETLQHEVLVALRDNPLGLTTQELATYTRRPYGSIQPRTSELQAMGMIEDSGERRMPEGGRCKVIVWRVK